MQMIHTFIAKHATPGQFELTFKTYQLKFVSDKGYNVSLF